MKRGPKGREREDQISQRNRDELDRLIASYGEYPGILEDLVVLRIEHEHKARPLEVRSA